MKQPNILATEISKLGPPLRMIYGGVLITGFSVCGWRIRPGIEPGFQLFLWPTACPVRGWQVPAYLLPPTAKASCKGILCVMVSRDLATMPSRRHPPNKPLEFFRTPPEQRPIQRL